VTHAGADRDRAHAVPHRHDHIRPSQHLFAGRAHERLVGVDPELADRRPNCGIDRALDCGAGGVHGYVPGREHAGQRRGELAGAAPTQADEDDVQPLAPRARLGALECGKALAGKAVGEDRKKSRDGRAAGEPFDRVLHKLLELVARVSVAVLAVERVDHRADLVTGLLIELHGYSSSSETSAGSSPASTGRSSSGSLVGSQSNSSSGVIRRNLRPKAATLLQRASDGPVTATLAVALEEIVTTISPRRLSARP
jgi:hypothetical protein